MLRGRSIIRDGPSFISFIFISLSTKYFLTIPFRKIYAYLFIPSFFVSYFIGLVLIIILRSISGVSTIGNSCDDRILSLFCGEMICLFSGKEMMVWENAFKNILLFLIFSVDEDRSFRISILKIMLLLREVVLMTEEYFRVSGGFMRVEFDKLHPSKIYLFLYSSKSISLESVWQCELILVICWDWFLTMSCSGSFLRMGWSPNWYRSGSTEFTLLISRKRIFLTGLEISFIYRYSRCPFRLGVFLAPFFSRSSVLAGVIDFLPKFASISGTSAIFISPSSGLLSDPD